MALDADTLLDRLQLKQQLSKWRTLSILFAAIALVALFGKAYNLSYLAPDHIARVTIEGVIVDDPKQLELIQELEDDPSVKAVLVRFDTPGGTAVGGEEYYLALSQLSRKKPTVAIMRTLCTSAGYMAALGTDYMVAREATITGSIGVIMQSMEFTELAKQLGIHPVTIKSGPNKAVPNPLEKLGSPQRQVIEGVVADFYEFFVGLVAERRQLETETVRKLADGRIYSGNQALKAGLIDEIGGEEEARRWLARERRISRDLDIRDVKPKPDVENLFSQFEQFAKQTIFSIENLSVTLDGLVSIWQPAGQ